MRHARLGQAQPGAQLPDMVWKVGRDGRVKDSTQNIAPQLRRICAIIAPFSGALAFWRNPFLNRSWIPAC
jgi:hypothetical protein